MVAPLTPIQEHLLRFRYLDNSLHFLSEVCSESKSNYASSIFFKYTTIDLFSFLDHYNGFIGLLKGEQKRLVLAMNYFLDEIFKNKQRISNTRNMWTAHVLEKGNFEEELSKESKNFSLQDLLIMINGLHLFTIGLQMIFPQDENYIIENFTKNEKDIRIESTVSNETIGLIINNKITTVNAMFRINNLNFQFDTQNFRIEGDEKRIERLKSEDN